MVAIPGRDYPIVIGPGARHRLGSILGAARAVVVADGRVADLHVGRIQTVLSDAHVIYVPPGEASKSLDQAAQVYDALAALQVARSDVLIAFGGGMVGDLAGFVAATWMRGIRHVMVPTTLESAVDASVGGKTGVNIAAGKNLVGAFHQPIAVVIDTDFLATLPPRDFRAGLAESVKHAVIADAEFLDWHERNRAEILNGDHDALTHLIARNCRIKAEVVADDERESGLRAILNHGHTLGHALELSLGFALRHGECVALGMIAENAIAVARGRLAPADAERVRACLASFGLPVRAPASVDPEAVLAACRLDKKNRGSGVVCMLCEAIGSRPVEVTVSDAELWTGLAGIGLTPAKR